MRRVVIYTYGRGSERGGGKVKSESKSSELNRDDPTGPPARLRGGDVEGSGDRNENWKRKS